MNADGKKNVEMDVVASKVRKEFLLCFADLHSMEEKISNCYLSIYIRVLHLPRHADNLSPAGGVMEFNRFFSIIIIIILTHFRAKNREEINHI